MNKADQTKALSKEQNLTVREAKGIANTILDSMTEALVNGDHIEIRGFGSQALRVLRYAP